MVVVKVVFIEIRLAVNFLKMVIMALIEISIRRSPILVGFIIEVVHVANRGGWRHLQIVVYDRG